MKKLTPIALALLAFQNLSLGLWATFLPRQWYDTFPGLGRIWVAIDGPYNEHLVRDVGAAALGLGLIAVAAFIRREALLVGVAGASKLVDADWGHAGLPHVHGHIIHKPPGQSDVLYFAAGLQAPVVKNIQALDGVFIGMHRNVWEAVRFDEATFDGFHVYDIDFSYRAHLAGYRLAVSMDLLLVHFSTGGYDLKWQTENQKFLRKFPALSGFPAVHRHSNLQVKLKTLEQIERLHCGLVHHGFGASCQLR